VLHVLIRSRFGVRKRATRVPSGLIQDPRGQSLVEFALVLPMLLVLLLGLADFGRVFAAGITVEAAARNGAEAAAQEYVQIVRNLPPGGVLLPTDYQRLHDIALDAVCGESDTLPNKTVSAGDCTMPIVAACVHDGSDNICGQEASSAPAECSALNAAWSNANVNSVSSPAPPYVEVRVCYRFTTLINLSSLQLPFGWGLSLGDIHLQRDREFTVACYGDLTVECG
jgi:hypothetical protein